MKRLLILFGIILITIDSYGQEIGKYNPFKMVIISTDTAIIDKSLLNYIDSVYQNHLDSYYNSIKQMEKSLSFDDFPDEMKEEFIKMQLETKERIDSARRNENEVKKFKYYHTISEYSSSVYQFYFNEYPPSSDFQLIKSIPITLANLEQVADSLNADYVVGYKNIYTEINNENINLKLTTILYSNSDKKIILEKETSGDYLSHGFMWTCDNPLSCLMINGVKSSTEIVYEKLNNKQKK